MNNKNKNKEVIKKRNKKSIYYITKTALASVFLIICSLIKIPFFVPFTLQSFGVFLVAGIMPECAAVSVLIFIFLGFLGVPVFSAGTGMAVFLSPTSGFILGFIITAFLAAAVFKKSEKTKTKSNATLKNKFKNQTENKAEEKAENITEEKSKNKTISVFSLGFLKQTALLFLCQIPTYILGCLTMVIFTNSSYSVLNILTLSVLPFILPDILKIIFAQIITIKVLPFLKSKNL